MLLPGTKGREGSVVEQIPGAPGVKQDQQVPHPRPGKGGGGGAGEGWFHSYLAEPLENKV